jgi:glycosyltransferase involved in cell wall biosynthesis
MMRILVLSTWFPYPPDHGSKSRAHYLVQALAEAHEVMLVAFRPQDTANGALPGNVRVVSVADDPFRYVSRPQWIKYASPIPLAFWPSRPMRRAVDEARGAEAWDAVVAIQTPVAQYAPRLAGTPRVIDIDTSFSFQLRERHDYTANLRTWLSWQKTHRYETRMFRRFQAGSVVSSKEIDFVRSMVKQTACRVEVVPNGVDCQHHPFGQYAVRPDTLIYNGALTYSANYDAMRFFLSKVYPLLRQQVPGLSLTITGSTAGVDRSGLRMDESVYFSGYVKDIRSLVGSSAVCVVPIRQGSGTRLKILEAMALGVPVVSTRKGAEGLDAADGEHLLLADDPNEFAAKTTALLRDTALRERLVGQARRLVEQRYEWRTLGQKFVELVEAAADKGTSQR